VVYEARVEVLVPIRQLIAAWAVLLLRIVIYGG